VLIFLSRGYFLSRNCMREVREAVRLNKPIVLVHETNYGKGGAPLHGLKEECPEDVREAVFGQIDALREVIPWRRVESFQLASLTSIAEHTLKHLPKHSSKSTIELSCVGYDISSFTWRLKTPHTIYASFNNPGAIDVAQQISAFAEAGSITVPTEEQLTDWSAALAARLPAKEAPLLTSRPNTADQSDSNSHGHHRRRHNRWHGGKRAVDAAADAAAAPCNAVASALAGVAFDVCGVVDVIGGTKQQRPTLHGGGDSSHGHGSVAGRHGCGRLRSLKTASSHVTMSRHFASERKTKVTFRSLHLAHKLAAGRRRVDPECGIGEEVAAPAEEGGPSASSGEEGDNSRTSPSGRRVSASPSVNSDSTQSLSASPRGNEKSSGFSLKGARRGSSCARHHVSSDDVAPEKTLVFRKSRRKSRKSKDLLLATPVFENKATSFFLLYLNEHTFVGAEGAALAAELRYILGLPGSGRENTENVGLPLPMQSLTPLVKVVMVHEQDPDKGAADFDRFLHVTPKDLVLSGLYKPIALSLYPGSHAAISKAEIVKAMGLEKTKKVTERPRNRAQEVNGAIAKRFTMLTTHSDESAASAATSPRRSDTTLSLGGRSSTASAKVAPSDAAVPPPRASRGPQRLVAGESPWSSSSSVPERVPSSSSTITPVDTVAEEAEEASVVPFAAEP
jgi:hypothetical protein